MKERIQKVLAGVGVASRRKIEELILEGHVTVNGRPATLGQKIDHSDKVRVKGKQIGLSRKQQAMRVLLYKKRTGEVVTREDPDGRKTVFRKLPQIEGGRWIAIGRLDINTSGILLFTNHGELARRLMHPSYEVEREYAVRVLGEVKDETLERLREGVRLDDGMGHFESVHATDGPLEDEGGKPSAANRWFNAVVKEGRHRLVRRLWESQRCQVSRLIRVRYGPIALGRGQRSGTARELEPAEVKLLLKAVQLDKEPK